MGDSELKSDVEGSAILVGGEENVGSLHIIPISHRFWMNHMVFSFKNRC